MRSVGIEINIISQSQNDNIGCRGPLPQDLNVESLQTVYKIN